MIEIIMLHDDCIANLLSIVRTTARKPGISKEV